MPRTPRQILEQYYAIDRAAWDRSTKRLRKLDPNLPAETTHHLAHNWHRCAHYPNKQNLAVRAELDRIERFRTWLYRREDKERAMADHARHVAEGQFIWCPMCKAS